MVWRFFQDTGLSGGTTNPSDNTFYVDSYKGSDLNVGSNTAPFQTIQKALDSSAAGGCDIIVAGRFKEGDFLNQRVKVCLIAEGDVYIEPDLATVFQLDSGSGTRHSSFNIDGFSGNQIRNYGKLHFKDFEYVLFRHASGIASPIPLNGAHNCEFKDILFSVGTNSSASANKLVQHCVFDNTVFLHGQYSSGSIPDRYVFIQNNNFINGAEWRFAYTAGSGGRLRDNYWDATSTLYQLTYPGSPHFLSWLWLNNHAEGSFANKVRLNTVGYNDLDAAQAANSAGIMDSVPQAQSPQFAGLNSDDYSLDPSSPNATGGYANGPIGAFDKGYSTNNVDSGDWATTGITISGVGAASVANITTPGTPGTLEELSGQTLNALEDVYVGPTYLPGMIQDFSAGQVIDKTPSASGGTPSIPTIEISYSTDNVSYSSWVEVPIGVVPLVDLAGKGSGDDTFDPSNLDTIHNGRIVARYVKRRITLRDDEVVLP